MTDWYQIQEKVKILPIVPQNLYGQIYSMGYLTIILFFSILGMIIYFIDLNIRRIIHNKAIALLLVLLSILFTIYSFEYTARASLRFIYYSIFVILFYKLLMKLKWKRT
jgi:hypothetical protein